MLLRWGHIGVVREVYSLISKAKVFVAIDFETANYDPTSACGVGVARVQDGRVVLVTSRLIRPPMNDFHFDELHGIACRAVASAPDFGIVWSSLAPELEDAGFLAAHNASFDRSVLEACCLMAGLASPKLPFVCSMQFIGVTKNTLLLA